MPLAEEELEHAQHLFRRLFPLIHTFFVGIWRKEIVNSEGFMALFLVALQVSHDAANHGRSYQFAAMFTRQSIRKNDVLSDRQPEELKLCQAEADACNAPESSPVDFPALVRRAFFCVDGASGGFRLYASSSALFRT